MFIVKKLNIEKDGTITVDKGNYGRPYDTIEGANQECIRMLNYYNAHKSERAVNKLIGEYLMVVDTEKVFHKCWYLFDGSVDYVRAKNVRELRDFIHSMIEAQDVALSIIMSN